MLKALFTFLILTSMSLAQSSSGGLFSVHLAKHANFSLSKAEMREAESIYESACTMVQREFHNTGELHPHFTVVIGTDRNEVISDTITHVGDELRMRKWNRDVFARGVVMLAFSHMLTANLIEQLGDRAVRYGTAMIDVDELK